MQLTDVVVQLSETVDSCRICGSGQAALDCMATQPWPDVPGHCLGEAAYRRLEVRIRGMCAIYSLTTVHFVAPMVHAICIEGIASCHCLAGVEGSI